MKAHCSPLLSCTPAACRRLGCPMLPFPWQSLHHHTTHRQAAARLICTYLSCLHIYTAGSSCPTGWVLHLQELLTAPSARGPRFTDNCPHLPSPPRVSANFHTTPFPNGLGETVGGTCLEVQLSFDLGKSNGIGKRG